MKMPEVGNRNYRASEDYPDGIMTAVGMITTGGPEFDVEQLTADQAIQLDRMVTSGILEADGPAMDPVRELVPHMQHMVENKVTRMGAQRRPYAPAKQKLEITRDMAPKSAVVGGGGQTMVQVTQDKSPSPKAAGQEQKK
jgi:hypothetical protein